MLIYPRVFATCSCTRREDFGVLHRANLLRIDHRTRGARAQGRRRRPFGADRPLRLRQGRPVLRQIRQRGGRVGAAGAEEHGSVLLRDAALDDRD